MSLAKCNHCDIMVDTDYEEMRSFDDFEVCRSCYEHFIEEAKLEKDKLENKTFDEFEYADDQNDDKRGDN